MNEILLNPRWPEADLKTLTDSANEVLRQLNIENHKVLSSSGSSAQSFLQTKLIFLSESAFLESARSVNAFFELKSSDVWGQCLPTFHVGGLGVEYRARLTNSAVVPMLENKKWDATEFYKILVQKNITVTSLVPTQLYDLMQLNQDPPHTLRLVFIGGGSIDEDLFLKTQKLNWPIVLTYGMTETCSMVATSKKMTAELNYQEFLKMKSLPHANVQMDDQGFLNIQGRSLLTASSYIDLQGRLRIQNHDQNDFFKTSDKVEWFDTHEFKILGRDTDFVKISGESVGLTHLRNVLLEVIDEVNLNLIEKLNPNNFALKAVSEQRRGHFIVIYTTENLDKTVMVDEQFNQKVRPFERIVEFRQVSELPRSELGKILWEQLDRYLL